MRERERKRERGGGVPELVNEIRFDLTVIFEGVKAPARVFTIQLAFNDRKISARMLHITGISQVFQRERATKCPEFSWLARKNYTRPGSQELCFKARNLKKKIV